ISRALLFTLPTYLEVRSTQTVPRFGSILRAFGSTRKSLAQPFKGLFRLPEMSWVLNSFPVRVGIEMGQPNIQSNCFTRWFSLLNALNIKTKLNVVPISTTNNPNPLDLFQLVEVQVAGSPHL